MVDKRRKEKKENYANSNRAYPVAVWLSGNALFHAAAANKRNM